MVPQVESAVPTFAKVLHRRRIDPNNAHATAKPGNDQPSGSG